MPDDTDASGPTVISRETLDAVAGWFDGIDATEMRRRLRPNIIIEAGEPFWEDQLYADRDSVVPFRLGDAELAGVNPCQRCVVPTRDPDTGAETEGFRERFVERREATLPEWVDRDWYDHYFRLMVCTRLGEDAAGSTLRVGDEVTVIE
nr:MOSC domain-containing protein [Natranaeroarchaeum aerophilus]